MTENEKNEIIRKINKMVLNGIISEAEAVEVAKQRGVELK